MTAKFHYTGVSRDPASGSCIWTEDESEGRGSVGKQSLAGNARGQGAVVAVPVPSTDANMVQGQILDRVEDGNTICTDKHEDYISLEDLSYKHETERHQAKQFVREDVHTNSIESV